MTEKQETFAERLARAMAAKGYKQADLIRIAGDRGMKLGKSQVSQYANGKTVPRRPVGEVLADVLADLARTHQVIVVTHLAQVAVRGQAHYVVRKAAGDEGAMPETALRQLPESERPAEIARMLSGDATETSLAHAREMLARAAG